MILYTFALYNNVTFSSSRSSFPRKTSSFFLFWYEPTENHTHHRIKRIMSDEEFDLKKKKKKSKKVDFDAFETEDTPNDGDAGVAAAVAEKIEDLDRTCVSCFSLVFLSFWVFLCLLFSSSASSFVNATAVFIRRKEMVTTMRTR